MTAWLNARAEMPTWHDILDAFQGRRGQLGDHLICRWSWQLMSQHRIAAVNPNMAATVRHRRRDIGALVDAWVETHVLGVPLGDAGIESLGEALDKLAAARVRAEVLFSRDVPVSDEAVKAAWQDLGYLATRWEDLAEQAQHSPRQRFESIPKHRAPVQEGTFDRPHRH
jgi:hypothetical protein